MSYNSVKFNVKPIYKTPKAFPSAETKKVLNLGRELELVKSQNEYIAQNKLKQADLTKVLYKKLDII
jgi:hypothetical protein